MYTTQIFDLWQDLANSPKITAYIPDNQTANCAIAILPGGAYYFRAEHEGKGYAEFFASRGILTFVVDYRCYSDKFPIPLLDARRAIQFIRQNSNHFGVNPDKIAIMGSSAGGHLAALTSTYHAYIPNEGHTEDELDAVPFLPNAQILCYPVIKLLGKGVAHIGSGKNLLAEKYADLAEELSPDLIATSNTPPAFIWHTFADEGVNVINSLDYARRLRQCGVPTELHVFPEGSHGLGLCKGDDKASRHAAKWTELLLDWLRYNNFI